MDDLECEKYQFQEWRISIYGKSVDEWKKLALWFKANKREEKLGFKKEIDINSQYLYCHQVIIF